MPTVVHPKAGFGKKILKPEDLVNDKDNRSFLKIKQGNPTMPNKNRLKAATYIAVTNLDMQFFLGGDGHVAASAHNTAYAFADLASPQQVGALLGNFSSAWHRRQE